MLQQSSVSSPVIHVFYFRGQPVEVRRACGGTFNEAAAALVATMLPQNAATPKVTQHSIIKKRAPVVVKE